MMSRNINGVYGSISRTSGSTREFDERKDKEIEPKLYSWNWVRTMERKGVADWRLLFKRPVVSVWWDLRGLPAGHLSKTRRGNADWWALVTLITARLGICHGCNERLEAKRVETERGGKSGLRFDWVPPLAEARRG